MEQPHKKESVVDATAPKNLDFITDRTTVRETKKVIEASDTWTEHKQKCTYATRGLQLLNAQAAQFAQEQEEKYSLEALQAKPAQPPDEEEQELMQLQGPTITLPTSTVQTAYLNAGQHSFSATDGNDVNSYIGQVTQPTLGPKTMYGCNCGMTLEMEQDGRINILGNIKGPATMTTGATSLQTTYTNVLATPLISYSLSPQMTNIQVSYGTPGTTIGRNYT